MKNVDTLKGHIPHLFIMIVLLTILACNNQNLNEAKKMANELIRQNNTTDYGFNDFSHIGVDAIPALIETIDYDRKNYIGYNGNNPKSNVAPFINYNYTGIRSAYEIEYLISDRKTERIHNYCIIVKMVDGYPNMYSLSIDDMKKLKAIYLSWWERHTGESLQQLQAEWKKGYNPLRGTGYVWV